MKQNESLPSLVSEALEITNAIIESGGEVTPELEARLNCNEVALAQKVDAYVMMSERLEQEEAYWKAKASEFSAIAKGFVQARERLKNNIKFAMNTLGTDEIHGGAYRYKLTKSAPKLVIQDEKQLPDEFMQTIVEKIPDKDKLLVALKDGFEIPGATLEDVQRLTPYKNTKKE
jgi:hypothetical protein